MTYITDYLGLVAPYYNLALVAVVILLFIFLFRHPNGKIYFKPWKQLFSAILIYIIEEILTVLNDAGIITVNKLAAPILEMFMISFFIYMLLLQREYLKKLR